MPENPLKLVAAGAVSLALLTSVAGGAATASETAPEAAPESSE